MPLRHRIRRLRTASQSLGYQRRSSLVQANASCKIGRRMTNVRRSGGKTFAAETPPNSAVGLQAALQGVEEMGRIDRGRKTADQSVMPDAATVLPSSRCTHTGIASESSRFMADVKFLTPNSEAFLGYFAVASCALRKRLRRLLSMTPSLRFHPINNAILLH